ncbi:tripartite tricarboxylate transporter substrate binding protein [Actinobacteria bacterium YIM 96077]|uniref:Tripartite tricarboxylate transporter substrate binding protein n=1 Tax=Phytoactinopolyspora halophila TaxID=1981511 RepID=A0A329QCU4_9ACTN|nr:tripartite tricarboxylate transporter substrate binding protein [Phytoactinopolyspora halophila]AYY14185.1 tripartite tricarboxylate transporter substrate binding protein [Actinobacteria bacterium YIM 96077]RAW10223.1 tripartite tricarboxylate transporter substrate binding protein [Phytoactinopolyspora halophila]
MDQARPVMVISGFLLSASLAACGATGDESSEEYPTQAVEYVIPFDPGGESDITARLQQEPLEDVLDTNVNITYQPGAGGALAWSELTRATPDGHTIAGFNLPHIIAQPMASGDVGYETDDFKIVNIFQSTPNLLVVREDSPIETLDEYISAAKEGADAMSIGGTGTYTPNHLGTLLLEREAGIELGYTEFSGTGATVPALLGGHVDSLFTFPTQLETQEGEMRPLAIATEERLPGLEDVPTFQEEGYDVVGGAYRGTMVPKDTPDEVVEQLAAAFDEIHSMPEVQEDFEENSLKMEDYGPEEAAEFIDQREGELEELFNEIGVLE